MTTTHARLEIHRSRHRYATDVGWWDARHSFSFGPHYDPENAGFGLLLVANDDRLAPAAGFADHEHRDIEIVSWVLAGELEHRDSAGHQARLGPGVVQRMSAGSGITHSESNASDTVGLASIQMWVQPDSFGDEPAHDVADVADLLGPGRGLVPIVSGREPAPLSMRQSDATFRVGRLGPDETVTLPDAAYVHVYVSAGSIEVDQLDVTLDTSVTRPVTGPWLGAEPPGPQPLRPGGAMRLRDTSGQTLTAGPHGAELLVWEMHSSIADALG